MDIKKTAKLAALELSAEESAEIEKTLGEVLEAFQQLQEVNTKGVEVMVTPIEVEPHLRHDEVKKWEPAEEALGQAPERSGNLYKVPPVV